MEGISTPIVIDYSPVGAIGRGAQNVWANSPENPANRRPVAVDFGPQAVPLRQQPRPNASNESPGGNAPRSTAETLVDYTPPDTAPYQGNNLSAVDPAKGAQAINDNTGIAPADIPQAPMPSPTPSFKVTPQQKTALDNIDANGSLSAEQKTFARNGVLQQPNLVPTDVGGQTVQLTPAQAATQGRADASLKQKATQFQQVQQLRMDNFNDRSDRGWAAIQAAQNRSQAQAGNQQQKTAWKTEDDAATADGKIVKAAVDRNHRALKDFIAASGAMGADPADPNYQLLQKEVADSETEWQQYLQTNTARLQQRVAGANDNGPSGNPSTSGARVASGSPTTGDGTAAPTKAGDVGDAVTFWRDPQTGEGKYIDPKTQQVATMPEDQFWKLDARQRQRQLGTTELRTDNPAAKYIAQIYLQRAGGDPDRARELAKADGWSF